MTVKPPCGYGAEVVIDDSCYDVSSLGEEISRKARDALNANLPEGKVLFLQCQNHFLSSDKTLYEVGFTTECIVRLEITAIEYGGVMDSEIDKNLDDLRTEVTVLEEQLECAALCAQLASSEEMVRKLKEDHAHLTQANALRARELETQLEIARHSAAEAIAANAAAAMVEAREKELEAELTAVRESEAQLKKLAEERVRIEFLQINALP